MRIIAALLVAAGLACAGYFVGAGFIDARALDRVVVVKGLAEREVSADTAIWPIQLLVADNSLPTLLANVESQTQQVIEFLNDQGFSDEEVSIGAPSIVDKQAQDWGNSNFRFRYSATSVVTVYSSDVARVRAAGAGLIELGKAGVVFTQDNYETRTQYLFNGLNEVKPAMVEEATRKAREVASKFADDSGSTLGKIRSARQGQFSISDRDSNNPHIKRVRVVSTLEYYLSD
ncbi:MAG: SIMPL domain-containing protein [Pseudomonadaceae bacterium]|nr:SIMPL domain-containing protein [Pseudomonadaceae bacterium]